MSLAELDNLDSRPATLPYRYFSVLADPRRRVDGVPADESFSAEDSAVDRPSTAKCAAHFGKLEAVGFVAMRWINQRKVPTTPIRRLLVEVDPFSQRDQFKWA